MIPRDSEPYYFDLFFPKKVKDKETGEVKVKPVKVYGGSLSKCITKIVRHRVSTKYESESPYLLEALNEMIELEKEMVKLCKESNEG